MLAFIFSANPTCSQAGQLLGYLRASHIPIPDVDTAVTDCRSTFYLSTTRIWLASEAEPSLVTAALLLPFTRSLR